jgi:hypothetical protein
VPVDETLFSSFDVKNVIYVPGKYNCMRRDAPKKKVYFTSSAFHIKYPKDTLEGNLGTDGNEPGTKYNTNDREKAVFELTLAVGGENINDDTRKEADALVAKELQCLGVMRATDESLIAQLFDSGLEAAETHKAAAWLKALEAEVTADETNAETNGVDRKYDVPEDVEAASEKNAKLRARLQRAQRRYFLDGATITPKIDQYDERGFKKRVAANGQEKRLEKKASMRVWNRVDWKGDKPKMPVYTQRMTKETWPTLLKEMEGKYNYNTFTYIDGKTKSRIPRDTYTPEGSAIEIIDPTVTPLTGRETLAAMQFTINVFCTGAMYGVKWCPEGDITICATALAERRQRDITVDETVTTGYKTTAQLLAEKAAAAAAAGGGSGAVDDTKRARDGDDDDDAPPSKAPTVVKATPSKAWRTPGKARPTADDDDDDDDAGGTGADDDDDDDDDIM